MGFERWAGSEKQTELQLPSPQEGTVSEVVQSAGLSPGLTSH